MDYMIDTAVVILITTLLVISIWKNHIQSGGEIGKRSVQVATIGSTRSNRQTRCTGSNPVLTTQKSNTTTWEPNLKIVRQGE